MSHGGCVSIAFYGTYGLGCFSLGGSGGGCVEDERFLAVLIGVVDLVVVVVSSGSPDSLYIVSVNRDTFLVVSGSQDTFI